MRQAGMKASSAAELKEPRFETGKPLLSELPSRYTAETMNNISAQWQRFAPPHIDKISGPIGRAAYGVCGQVGGERIHLL
jgi:hypothetical protein